MGVAWPRCLACSVRAVLTYQIGKDLLVNHSTAHVARVVRGAEVIADHIEHPERRLFVHQHLPTVGLAWAAVGRMVKTLCLGIQSECDSSAQCVMLYVACGAPHLYMQCRKALRCAALLYVIGSAQVSLPSHSRTVERTNELQLSLRR